MAYSYENELNALKEAQKKSAIADLENTRNQTLSDLAAEQQKNTANFGAQRNTANVQNKMNARNFQEYLASTGRANSGLASQAKLQSDNNWANQLNAIRGSENAALADIGRRTTNANNAYNSGLASANANIEANYIQNLLDQRAKAAQLAQQEKEFNESVRQFNEQMKYNYANLYSNFSRGSGGGGGSSYASNDDAEVDLTGSSDRYFSNGYQPKYIGNNKLSSSGMRVSDVFINAPVSDSQNIWKANGKYYVWIGNGNKGGQYVDVTSKVNQSKKKKQCLTW